VSCRSWPVNFQTFQLYSSLLTSDNQTHYPIKQSKIHVQSFMYLKKTIIVIKGCHFAPKAGYISLIDWCLTPTLEVFKLYCDVECISEKKVY
jgi:hypothetical protein